MTADLGDLCWAIAVAAATRHDLDVHEEWALIYVKNTPGCGVYIARTIYNWRIVEVEHGVRGLIGPSRGWCYHSAFEDVLEAARRWDGAKDSEPTGWARALGTERRHGEPQPGIRQV